MAHDLSKMFSRASRFSCGFLFTVTVVRDNKILPAPGANQVAEFSGYRSLANREQNNRQWFTVKKNPLR